MIFQLTLITFCIFVCIVTIYSSQTTTDCQPETLTDTRLPLTFRSNDKSKISNSNSRSKRFLIYQGNGILKMVLGFSQPLDILDKHPYRQLAVSYGFHLQYTPPPAPVYWWTYFVNSTAWAHARSSGKQRRPKKLLLSYSNEGANVHKHNYHHNPHLNHYGTFVQRCYRQPAIVYDFSRYAIYKAIETVFNSKGLPGERCLLRTICEISQRPLYENNAIHGIINAIFSPTVSNIDGKYFHAKQIGVHGVGCDRIYWGCNEGIKWLEQMSYYL